MPSAEPIVTELTIDGSGAERGQAQYVRAMASAQAQMERTLAVNARLAESYSRQAQVSPQLVTANDNVARSYSAANDNIAKASEGFRSTVVEIASMTNHLKFAALAAYSLSPAFRAMVNPAITASVAALGPAAVSAAGAAVKALTPMFALLSRIALPILAIVTAWELLNSVISKGSDLLEKYGGEQRNLVSGVDDSLKKLTRFQDGDLSAGQVQQASELGARLAAAKQTISDFFAVQLNLTSPALKLQNAWVKIVETIAAGIDSLNGFINRIGPLLTGIVDKWREVVDGISNLTPDWMKTAFSYTPIGLAVRASNALSGAAPVEPSRDDALRAARQRLAAGMGSQGTFANRYGQAVNDLANPPKPEKAETVKDTAREFDRLVASMSRSAAVQEAEAKAVDASVGEHARLRAEMRLQESAMQDIAKHGGDIDDYSNRIKELADRFGRAAQEAAELKLKSDIKFTGDTMFLSDADKHIASILRRVYGSEWKNMMKGPIADAMRWNDIMQHGIETVREVGTEISKSVVHALMDGKNVSEALASSLKNLSARLADKAIENLLSGQWEKAAISAVAAVATFVGSKLFGDDGAAKKLQEAKIEFAGMAKEVDAFVEASKGFDLAPIVSQLRQLRDSAEKYWMAAKKANDEAQAARISQAYVDSVINATLKFGRGNEGLSDAALQIRDLNEQAAQLRNELLQINPGFANLADIMQNGVAKQIEAIRKAANDNILADINDATGRGFVNELNALFDRVSQLKSEQSITGVDTSLIDRFLVVQAQKIVDSADLAGDAFKDLLGVFPNLTGLVHEATASLEEQAQAQQQLQDSLNASARSIVDYINNLNGGSESTLSPMARLAAAQATFNATSQLAQANNIDALNRWSQDAENFRKAARDVFASGTQYQSIEALIKATGLGLPAVTTSTDPVVTALLNVQTAVQGTTTAVGTNTSSTASLLNTAVARLDTAITRLVDVVNNLSAVVGRLDTSNAILTALQNLNTTAAQQLQLLNNNLTITGVGAVGGVSVGGGVTAINTSNNNLLTALNKIVVNTYATAQNTSQLSGVSAKYTGALATGGVIPPFGVALVSEHSPGGGRFIQAGAQPITVSPFAPSNDNSAVVAELRELRAQVARLQMMVAASGKHVAQTFERKTDEHIVVTETGAKRTAAAITQAALDNKAG